MNYRASKLSRVTLETDQSIGSGQTITVFGIVAANATDNPALIDMQDASGTNKLTIIVPCKETVEVRTEWVADGGLQIDGLGSSDVTVTVLHSSGGS